MAHYLVEYAERGNPAERERLRGDHIAYRKGLGAGMALAGPLLAEDDAVIGSVVILAAATQEEARQIAIADPYVAAGVLDCVSVRKYRIAAMQPPQG